MFYSGALRADNGGASALPVPELLIFDGISLNVPQPSSNTSKASKGKESVEDKQATPAPLSPSPALSTPSKSLPFLLINPHPTPLIANISVLPPFSLELYSTSSSSNSKKITNSEDGSASPFLYGDSTPVGRDSNTSTEHTSKTKITLNRSVANELAYWEMSSPHRSENDHSVSHHSSMYDGTLITSNALSFTGQSTNDLSKFTTVTSLMHALYEITRRVTRATTKATNKPGASQAVVSAAPPLHATSIALQPSSLRLLLEPGSSVGLSLTMHPLQLLSTDGHAHHDDTLPTASSLTTSRPQLSMPSLATLLSPASSTAAHLRRRPTELISSAIKLFSLIVGQRSGVVSSRVTITSGNAATTTSDLLAVIGYGFHDQYFNFAYLYPSNLIRFLPLSSLVLQHLLNDFTTLLIPSPIGIVP